MVKYQNVVVYKKPDILRVFGYLYYSAQACGTKVFVPKVLYDQIKDNTLTVQNKAILVHEITHTTEQEKLGLLSWIIRYLLFKEFRYQQEIIANKAELEYLHKKGMDISKLIKSRARAISGWRYLWAEKYEKIILDLKN